jgi:transposase InsO family protein
MPLSRHDIRRELADHDALDVACACAALQLLPANASHLDRLSALAATSLSVGASTRTQADPDALARWLITGANLHEGPPWDPYEGPFAEPINFYGGGYLIQTGGNAEAVFNLRTLIGAVFLERQRLGNTALQTRLLRLTTAVLTLATHTCAAGHVQRWVSAESAESVLIPSQAAMRFLRAGVCFTRDELVAITHDEPDALDPITCNLAGPPTLNVNGTQFNARPLLRRGDLYLLVEPGVLAVALRHAIITLLLESGLRDELVERHARASMGAAVATSKRMGWSVQEEYPAEEAPIVSLLGGFDTDKAFDIAILYEDFEGYRASHLETTWDLRRWETPLVAHLRAVEEQLSYGAGERPNDILHVIIAAGCGRPHVLGIRDDTVLGPQLVASLENFHQVGMATFDPLKLWKFASAGERVRDATRVFAFSMLDEYAAWNESESYYFGDDGRPNFVSFDPSYGRAHREKVARDTDVHGVVSPKGHWTEAVRLHEAPHIPIYGVLNDLGGEALMLVEGASLPIWIKAADVVEGARRAYFDLVDCVSYWLWQATPSLPDLSTTSSPRLVVEVALSDPDAWAAALPVNASGAVAEAEQRGDGVLRITVLTAMLSTLDRADNTAERELLRVVLGGMDSMLEEPFRLGPETIDYAVDRNAPLGAKKKITLLRADDEIAVIGDRLPRYRRISRADTEQALDEAGEHLDLPVGDIPSPAKNNALKEVVAFHYLQIKHEVSNLSPNGLLERLVGMHEATLHYEATQRRTLGARVAAFGGTQLIDDMRRSLPDATQTSVALRFLIEYVTAQPPNGARPFSLASYDRLVAIVGQIASRGMTSDIVHFGIDEPDLSYLVSGRLGLADTGRFQKGQQSFLDAMLPAHARALAENYDAPWRAKPETEPPAIAEIDEAATAEWGFSVTELLTVFSALSGLAQERGGVAVSMPLTELRGELSRELGWTGERTSDALALLSLEPRLDFTKPPVGFLGYDLWPWRFNRRLSYMRRPVLLRPGSQEDEAVWGMRQPEQAGRFLVDLITSERLNAASGEMRVARPPKFGPPRVRVLQPMQNGREEDHRGEAQTTHAGADHPQAQRGRSAAGRGDWSPGDCQGAGGLRADLSPLARAVRRDAGRRRQAPEGAAARERPAQAPGRRQGAREPRAAGDLQGKLVSPSRRRAAVLMLQDRLDLSERRACQITGQHRSTQRREPCVADDEQALRNQLREISRERPRWGYRRAHATLLSEGWSVNRKRVQRLWREEGLRVPVRRRKRRRLGTSTVPAKRLRAKRPDHVWALDFQFDQTADGRILKLLHVVDEFTREALAIECRRRIDADATVAVLERLVGERGRAPEHIRCDNGPELTANALRDWCRFARAGSAYIEPGSPWQNPYVESFGSRVRDELLSVELFACLAEARIMVEDFREDYNERRPHSALQMAAPARFAHAWKVQHDPTTFQCNDYRLSLEVDR